MKTKTPKKVIAKFQGKGFYLKDKRVGHKSHVLYLDKQSYLESDGEDFIHEIMRPFISAIGATLENKRIKPGSLRISFHILEK